MLINRKRTFKYRRIKIHFIIALLAILVLLFLINSIFQISDQDYDIKDIPSESLGYYFSLEE
ncbi:MAG TPA: hypothetical protein GXZ78_05490, partial [Eubacteriaceae bacterium]|nr:hypothetical protein [Eubacteriaceae bacterium]